MNLFAATPLQNTPRVLATQRKLVVVYKPSGMPVHPASKGETHDLMSWVKQNPELPEGLTLLHRLDKETSGLVLLAPPGEIQRQIQQWLTEHLIRKTYLALVWGQIPAWGRIEQPLQDQRRKKPLEAYTRYQRLESFADCCLVKLMPETGRKHQLRKHMQGLGHGIVGDRRYPSANRIPSLQTPHRLWLHAAALELPQGWDFECPLPVELAAHLEKLRAEKEEEEAS